MRIPVPAGIAAALFVAACAAPAPPAAASATPALWRVADADTEIFLLGTIHALPRNIAWGDGRLGQAIAAADTLVLEVVEAGDAQAQAATFLRIGRAQGLPPLAERVPAAERAALALAIEKSGIPAARLDGMKTWAAALLIGAAQWRGLGAERSEGVESRLTATFRAAGKPVLGLESAEQQFGFFDALPEAAERQLLIDTIRDSADPAPVFNGMLDAWKRGDPAAITATFDDQLRRNPALKATLIDARNQRWANWIAARLAQPGRVLVAVGAGHLAGEGSVQQQLAARGIEARRTQ